MNAILSLIPVFPPIACLTLDFSSFAFDSGLSVFFVLRFFWTPRSLLSLSPLLLLLPQLSSRSFPPPLATETPSSLSPRTLFQPCPPRFLAISGDERFLFLTRESSLVPSARANSTLMHFPFWRVSRKLFLSPPVYINHCSLRSLRLSVLKILFVDLVVLLKVIWMSNILSLI